MSECTVDYMEHALSLAELALGYTSPNPAVGAAIVKDGVVVGMGYTQPPGSAHAEIMALQQAGERANGGNARNASAPKLRACRPISFVFSKNS